MSTQRPISPHLQIYKPQLTSVLSISHRFAGVTLLVGCLVFCLVFFTAIVYPAVWDYFYRLLPAWLMMLFNTCLLGAAVYHWLNGIRHSLWDRLIGLELSNVYWSGYILMVAFVIIMAAVLLSWL